MKEYNEQVVETLDDAGCIIANKNIIIDNLQARIAELEAENERLKVDRAKKQKESVTIFDVNCELRQQLTAAQEELRAANSECDLFRKNGRISDANEIATLKDQLAKAEQRVAEACALQVATETKFHWLDAARVAKEIRSGEWRKHMKGD